ncbi:MAG: aldehyde dehydrogenase [Planctomycetaceae bacterium]|nr:aldehyde dehydrogenase [Planctomycetaceae bacterium]
MSTSSVERTTEFAPAVASFLATPVHKSFAGGRWVEAADGQTFDVLDPGSGNKIATVTSMKKADVDKVVDAAQDAFNNSGWATMQVSERAACLHRIADAVEKRIHEFAQIESLDCGKIYAQAIADIQNFIDTFRYFADLSQAVNYRQVIAVKHHEAWVARHAWGPCGFIIPWNFPFLLTGWGLAPALAAGNTCVLKPAEDTPLSALYLCRVIQEQELLPAGVLNVVTGLGETAGAAVSQNPKFRRMSFTGSPEVGRLVAEACGRNLVPVKCELGGKGAAVVFNDVDIAETADKLVQAITFHTGQVCCDATRWLIQRDIYDDFVDECITRMKSVQIGYQFDKDAQMGPLVNAKQRARVLGYLQKGVADGADLILEGGAAQITGKNGFYVKPALLAGSLNNVAAREEIFGPVAYLAPFTTEEEGIRLANDTEYGLGNSVWSRDLQRCARVAESFRAGNGWINAHNVIVHGVPYAGVGKSGMGGGVVSPDTLNDYLRPISVVRPL